MPAKKPLSEYKIFRYFPMNTPFMEKIHFEPMSGCWLWGGTVNNKGYGLMTNPIKDKPMMLAHRYSYELHKGPVPEGLVVDHKCCNSHCVNPDHLQAITFRENVMKGESNTAKNARMTHCHRGHPLPSGYEYGKKRQCRECKNLIRRVDFIRSQNHASAE